MRVGFFSVEMKVKTQKMTGNREGTEFVNDSLLRPFVDVSEALVCHFIVYSEMGGCRWGGARHKLLLPKGL